MVSWLHGAASAEVTIPRLSHHDTPWSGSDCPSQNLNLAPYGGFIGSRCSVTVPCLAYAVPASIRPNPAQNASE